MTNWFQKIYLNYSSKVTNKYLQISGRNVADCIVVQTAGSPPVSLLVVKHFELFALGERQDIVFPLCCRWPEIRHCSKYFHAALPWIIHPWHYCPSYSLLAEISSENSSVQERSEALSPVFGIVNKRSSAPVVSGWKLRARLVSLGAVMYHLIIELNKRSNKKVFFFF